VSRSLRDVVNALSRDGILIDAPGDLPQITGLSADARRLQRGMLFCAVRGAVQDGHRYVADAAQRGAAAALVEDRQSVPIPQILIRNGRRAAAIAAEAWYGHPAGRLQLIGVTGTNGKSTSVSLARHVLAARWPMGAIGTLGCVDPAGRAVESEAGNLTTPGPIDLQATLAALIERGAAGAAMEVSSHSLDQGRVERLTFRAAIFTNLTRDHLDYHETLEAYFAAKTRLIGYLASDGLAVTARLDT
jgi:UDP-N-acetylmuramoyl-L-alanyl-D-glutamate--2,6-diaminopimelate ligase